MQENDTPESQTEQPQPTAMARRQTIAGIAVHQGTLRPRNFPELIEFAKMLAHSGMVPKDFQGRVGDVLVAIQMGGEVGLSPMASIQNIAVINGRPSLWGDALLSLVQSHPDCEDIVEELDEDTMTATCTIKRRGRTPTVRTFSQADAVSAKLWSKAGPWTQYPKRMLQMRARGFAVRDAFPDALRGLYVAEEAADIGPPVTASLALTAADFALAEPEVTPEPKKAEVPEPDSTPEEEVQVAAGPPEEREPLVEPIELEAWVKQVAKAHGTLDAVVEKWGPPDTWKAADWREIKRDEQAARKAGKS